MARPAAIRGLSLSGPLSRLAAASLGAAALLLAGCSSGGVRENGPLGNGGDPGGLCVPVPVGGVFTYGITTFTNTGSSVAVMDNVALADPDGTRLLAAYIVPITGNDIYGVRDGFPPDRNLPASVDWARHTQADGTRIPPSPAFFKFENLLVVIKSLRPIATATGIDVYYREAGQRYHFRSPIVFLLTAGTCGPNWNQGLKT